MASGIATVWLPVEDMSRAVKFYGETLGLTVKNEGDDWSEVDGNGVTIGLNARESTVVIFDAPTEPGEYPFVCSFPGHWMTMRGVLRVE